MPGNPSLPRCPRHLPGRIRSKKQVNTSQFQCFWLSWGPRHESRITNHSWLWGGLCHACTTHIPRMYLACTSQSPPNYLACTWLVPGLSLALGGFGPLWPGLHTSSFILHFGMALASHISTFCFLLLPECGFARSLASISTF